MRRPAIARAEGGVETARASRRRVLLADGATYSQRASRSGLLALSLAVVAAGGACSRAPRIEIGGQEARLSPVLVGVCSIFMKIENPGNGDDALVGATLELPGAIVELHDVRGGRMVRADKMPVPANGALELRPGGPHIMVFNLPRSAAAGQELTLRLVFETSGERLTSVRIGG